MTSHNRCATTLSALDSLKRQCDLSAGTELQIHLVDAGSTDGTPEAVRRHHPDVALMSVGDDVFWGHGMRIASRNSRGADRPPFTHQLWLNDDVVLDDDALAHLLTVGHQEPGAVVVGAVHDGERTTYSGRRGPGLDLVEPTGRPEPCDTYNGNVVLIPSAVRARVGDVDKRFPHGMGDYDHGFRVRKAGIPAVVAPRHIGRCRRNPPLTGSREPGIGPREALRRLASTRELPPRAWWRYCLRHTGYRAPVLMMSPYVKTLVRAGVGR
ncbi:glycosyltransferase family 2 protein [Streptomyces sp. TRM66268-LWL]|uniref:Glycosyltransferase family 2 protein n=1 Tax=Streptomyces polyasparticus TaxID=2767826 RepID=A0ABR7SG04_9ACTN|nr:glycosyltransferase [Streptomyces polyasparticus]MBC9714427.1 glycosyltransferase family 2 protein [Streptomyces polyasparticus]